MEMKVEKCAIYSVWGVGPISITYVVEIMSFQEQHVNLEKGILLRTPNASYGDYYWLLDDGRLFFEDLLGFCHEIWTF